MTDGTEQDRERAAADALRPLRAWLRSIRYGRVCDDVALLGGDEVGPTERPTPAPPSDA